MNRIKQENWDKLNEVRKIAVMDHCFQSGDIKTIKDHLISGDYDKAAEVMGPLPKAVDGIKARYELRASYMKEGITKFKDFYVVKSSDNNFGEVANNLGISQKKLKELNPDIKNYDRIFVGQKINIGDQISKISNLHSAHKFNDDHHFAYAFLHPQNDINFKSDYGRSRFTDENHFKRGSYWQAWQHNQERPKEWSPHLLKNKKDAGDNSAPPTAAADGPKAPSSGGGGGWFSAFTENLSNKFTNFFSPPKQDIVELRVSKSSIFEQYKPNFNSLYDFTLTKKSGFINDPSWLYIAPIQQKQSLGDDFSRFLDAKQKLIHKVSSCAQSGFCFDSYESMVRDVAASFLGNYESFSNLALLLQTNKYRVIERASSELSFARKSFSYGNWVTPIRKEMKYAASHVSPLVLDLNGDGIKLSSYQNGVYFDIDADKFMERVGWLSSEDAHLARDLNKNGKIDDITELFGDELISAFSKLALLDSNEDGVIDEDDDEFNELLIWQDKNSNGYSESDELKSLSEAGIKSISLNKQNDNRVVEGNKITATSYFKFINGKVGEIADVHYHNDDMDSWYKGKAAHFNLSKIEEYIILLRDKLFEILDDLIQNPSEIISDASGDWLANIIKTNTNELIKYIKNPEEFIAKAQGNINTKFHKGQQNQNKECAAELNKIKDNNFKIDQEKNELLKNVNARFKQAQANITSFYTQAHNAEIKQINELIHKGVEKRPTAIIGEELNKKYSELIENDKAKKLQELQKEFDDIRDNSISKKIEENEERKYNTKKECAEDSKKLNQLLRKELVQKSQNEIQDYKQITDALIAEASTIYKFFTDKILQTGKESFDDLPASFTELKKYYTDYHNSHTQNNESIFDDEIKVDPETIFMPQMRGYGQIPSLHIAMSSNQNLKKMVIDLCEMKFEQAGSLKTLVQKILYKWAEIPDSYYNHIIEKFFANIDVKKLKFIEIFTGQEFKQLGVSNAVGQFASAAIQKAWDIILSKTSKTLLVQGPLSSVFENATYSFGEDKIYLNTNFNQIIDTLENLKLKENLTYDFWILIGQVLSSSIDELNISINQVNQELTKLAGQKIYVQNAEIYGDESDNFINGTESSDTIYGLGGNDEIHGKNESDHIDGGKGNDKLFGENGIDRIYGGEGDDFISGGNDRDFIYGDEGNDEIHGDEGDDVIEGGPGADILDGGEGKNTISYGSSKTEVKINLETNEASGGDAEGDKFSNFTDIGGSEGDDVLIGDAQDNIINGEGGNDEIHGGDGDDQLFGATGDDKLYGGKGNDHLIGFQGKDEIDGGEGIDTVDYNHPYGNFGVIVNLAKKAGFGGYATGDTYKDVENVIGTRFDDEIIGDEFDNYLNGAGGGDKIYGGDGDDRIVGGNGLNKLYGENGNDRIFVGTGVNEAYGGNGTDTISYILAPVRVKVNMTSGTGEINSIIKDNFIEFENVQGSQFDDEIYGDEKINVIFGEDGNDYIDAGDGDDIIYPGKGSNKILGGKGNDQIIIEGDNDIDGGEGIDIINFSKERKEGVIINLQSNIFGGGFKNNLTIKNIEGVSGTNLNDHITGDNNNNRLFGNNGDDYIYGLGGNDEIYGGDGKNRLYGGDGNDIFYIGEGQNLIYGDSGINTIGYQFIKGHLNISLPEGIGSKYNGAIDNFKLIQNIFGSQFNDLIIGDNKNNMLNGLDGNDWIDGGEGNDKIEGGPGINTLIGGKGKDEFFAHEGENNIDGGDDEDTVSYVNININIYNDELTKAKYNVTTSTMLSTGQHIIKKPAIHYENITFPKLKGVEIDLSKSVASKSDGIIDKILKIENIIGTHFDDLIIGDELDNKLYGEDGDDIIHGLGGNDYISFGFGKSDLYGNNGDDTFVFTDSSRDYKGIVISGVANIDGGSGRDILNLFYYPFPVHINMTSNIINYSSKNNYTLKSVEIIYLTKFDDSFIDSDNDDTIFSGDGNDYIYLSNGDDKLDAGAGNDIIVLNGVGKKELLGGAGADTYIIGKTHKSSFPIIYDFNKYEDKISLINYPNISSKSDIKFEEVIIQGSNYTKLTFYIDIGLVLSGFHAENLSGENFMFYQE
jgi:Ca2+-binding RTX toxin-like protein